MKIVFLGTPDFAVASLKALVENGNKVVGVVTMPDKKSGRGMKLQQSPVKKYALEKSLHVMQPINLKDEDFQKELGALEADLQIIVAFRMLPDNVWKMPKYGTFNLHGSMLPDYRGAAPINWAIINGETQTGVTTFFLEHEIDTGEIIDSISVEIGPNELAGELHDKLMIVGADLVVKTAQKIIEGVVITKNQKNILNGRQPKLAYKIFKKTCQINWNKSVGLVHNHIRGLSPYPAAYSSLQFINKKEIGLKLFRTEKSEVNLEPGEILTDGKTELLVGCINGSLKVLEIQLAGKKRMAIQDFLQGINLENARFV
jgi:methionyl-tRNA formyltransferase